MTKHSGKVTIVKAPGVELEIEEIETVNLMRDQVLIIPDKQKFTVAKSVEQYEHQIDGLSERLSKAEGVIDEIYAVLDRHVNPSLYDENGDYIEDDEEYD